MGILLASFPISNNDSRRDRVSARDPLDEPNLPNIAISLDPLILRLPSKTKCEPNPKIGKEDALGVLIALVTPLLLFQGMPVE
jgi:hypothetical protein